MKNDTYYFFDDITNIKNFDLNNIKTDKKVIQKYSYLLYRICDNQRFEIR